MQDSAGQRGVVENQGDSYRGDRCLGNVLGWLFIAGVLLFAIIILAKEIR